ncbi:MAG: hypothetical protein N2167_09610 [Flavobacteriales bacterium]|nr:hypothetical protein [Flavobacteriales bacterium]
MKKVLFGVLAIAFLASCGAKGNGPEKVATEYLNALKNKEWDKAKALGNEDTKAKIDGIKGFGGDAGITEVKDVKCEVKENEAECSFCCMKEGGSSKLKLVKEGDKWIVNDKKEMGGGDLGAGLDSAATQVEETLSTEMDNATTEEKK